MIKNFREHTHLIFRGGRPENAGDLYCLKERGVKTIISLEEGYAKLFRSYDDEKKDWEAMGGKFFHHRCSNIFPPTADETRTILKEIASNIGPDDKLFIHCYSGVDRTGFICAAQNFFSYQAYRNSPSWDRGAEVVWRAEALDKGTHWWFWWWKKHFIEVCGELRKARWL